MANKANMYYRFVSDKEPSEEQLTSLMQDVKKEVRRKNANLQSIVLENIRREYQNAKRMFPNL